ncbi:MAG: hypothetical protein K2X99_00060 [Gemmatimonadaceae bacterium]|nr:hypothetical protein [Gemmatimonadaceae bacterium]
MPNPSRPAIIHGALLCFAVALVVKAAQVQLVQHESWVARAAKRQRADAPLPAPRGAILDASGAMLVETRQLMRLKLSAREVLGPGDPKQPRSATQLARLTTLRRSLTAAGVPSAVVARAVDTLVPWVEIPGRFLPTEVAEAIALPGVRTTPVLERVPPGSEGLRRLLGRTDAANRPLDGLELALDGVLTGVEGRTAQVKDKRGRQFASPEVEGTAARPGHTVVLTLNRSLQEIAERALGDAVERMGASGGDIVVLDPATGEVRAMATRRAAGLATSATAITEPFEPGSTLKPFVAGWLVDHGRAKASDVVPTFNGKWTLNGRTITDEHKAPRMALDEVIRNSSNIGIVQFASRMSSREQFEMLRDLGFGVATGVPYPSESNGSLAVPARWSAQSPASLAMGYELAVTPLQLAAAYGAIANGGRLMQPALVREVRDAKGAVQWRHAPRVLRRVMSEAAAAELRSMLKGVVDSGTAAGMHLNGYDLAGKTGTARRANGHGGYAKGSYTASFVGLFPADKPLYVLLVKLDDPRGVYFGGKTAAPVSRVVLEAAIAARDAALDRGALARAATPRSAMVAAAAPTAAIPATPVPETVTVSEAAASVPFVISLGGPRSTPARVVSARTVPDVAGLSAREATRALHRAGFRVAFVPALAGSIPVAGATAAAGSLVRVGERP